MIIALGLVLVVVGVALLFNLGGSATALIGRVTSRSLGELAPGYAASTGGFRVYATLILALGIAVSGVAISSSAAILGAILLATGVLIFALASVAAIAGEIRTYRALRRGRG